MAVAGRNWNDLVGRPVDRHLWKRSMAALQVTVIAVVILAAPLQVPLLRRPVAFAPTMKQMTMLLTAVMTRTMALLRTTAAEGVLGGKVDIAGQKATLFRRGLDLPLSRHHASVACSSLPKRGVAGLCPTTATLGE